MTSCTKEETNNEDNIDFYDNDYRIGLWISPDKRDTLQFIDDHNLIRKGHFYVHEEYLYRIDGGSVFIRLPDDSYETQHQILDTDKNKVILGNMYLSIGFYNTSGAFLKENQGDPIPE